MRIVVYFIISCGIVKCYTKEGKSATNLVNISSLFFISTKDCYTIQNTSSLKNVATDNKEK